MECVFCCCYSGQDTVAWAHAELFTVVIMPDCVSSVACQQLTLYKENNKVQKSARMEE